MKAIPPSPAAYKLLWVKNRSVNLTLFISPSLNSLNAS